jgi:hypothetical protein
MKLSGLKKKLLVAKLAKSAINAPKGLVKKYKDNPQVKAMQGVMLEKHISQVYKPCLSAIDKAIAGKKLSWKDKRALDTMLGNIKRGKGYTRKTRDSIDNELPGLIERMKQGELSRKDLKEIKRELLPFVEHLRRQERISSFKKSGII